MQKVLLKTGAGILLLLLAVAFLWYSLATSRIAAGDGEFIRHNASARLFPESGFWWGNYYQYVQKDPSKAMESYRETIMQQPLFIEAWLEMVKTELRLGKRDEASRLIALLAPGIAGTSYWKWKEILIAYDLNEEDYFQKNLNFLFAKAPERIMDACSLALQFWGNWGAVVSHTSTENRQALLKPLIQKRAVGEFITVWESLKASGIPNDKNLLLEACDFALENGRIKQAREMWDAWLGADVPGIQDGEFEMPPVNGGFGWRICEHPQVDVRYTTYEHHGGLRALQFHFSGSENTDYHHVSQIVPVKPGGRYVFDFAYKSRELTTDQGVFLKISGYKSNIPEIRSNPVTGTSQWTVEKLDVQIPENCGAVVIEVCRAESSKLNGNISGDYWLDSIELREAP